MANRNSKIEEVLKVDENMLIFPLFEDIYIHVTWHTFVEEGGRFPINGIICIRNNKALLIDTPATNKQTEQLVGVIKEYLNSDIELFIPTNFKEESMGGFEYLKSIGVKSLANTKTKEICEEKGLPVPDDVFDDEYKLTEDFDGITCFYPGKAFTEDNICVYFKEQRILFGSSMVKSSTTTELKNVDDAFPEMWEESIQNIANRFPALQILIPGRELQGDKSLIKHTKELVEEYLKSSH
jgi:metallo-beta-lactamase class B